MLNIKGKPGKWAALAACVLIAFLLLQGCNSSGSKKSSKTTASKLKKIPVEKGMLQMGEASYAMEKVGTDQMIIPGLETLGVVGGIRVWLEKDSDYALLGTDNGIVPDGSFAVIYREGTTWLGNSLSVKEEDSRVNPDNSVILLSGKLTDIKGGKTIQCSFRVTESQIGGGTSEFRIEGTRAYLNGDLGTRTFNQVIDLIKNHPEVKTIVEEDVPGSVNDEINMKTGTMLRDYAFHTIVAENGEISSGGVDLFCAGVTRTLEKDAVVGVHSWSDDEGNSGASLPKDDPQHNAQIEYFTRMLGAPKGKDFYFYTLQAAPPEGIHIMTQKEIFQWGIATP